MEAYIPTISTIEQAAIHAAAQSAVGGMTSAINGGNIASGIMKGAVTGALFG